MSENKLSYAEKFKIMDREALATLTAALAVTALFWLAIFLLKDNEAALLAMPAWFTVSCVGGYLASVLAVIIVVKYFMKNFDLDEEDPDER